MLIVLVLRQILVPYCAAKIALKPHKKDNCTVCSYYSYTKKGVEHYVIKENQRWRRRY
jgi:hypothetical protein